MQQQTTKFRLSGRYAQLEPLEMHHIPELLSAAALGKETFRWTSVPTEEDAMRKYVETACRAREMGQAFPFIVMNQKDHSVVGSTRFANLEYWAWSQNHPMQRPLTVPDAGEIGWTWLSGKAQRTGINTEMKLLMLSYAFEVWKVHRVTLKTDVRNVVSRKAIERIGGKLDGILRAHLPASDGGIRDTAIYSLIVGEWDSVKRALQSKLDHNQR